MSYIAYKMRLSAAVCVYIGLLGASPHGDPTGALPLDRLGDSGGPRLSVPTLLPNTGYATGNDDEEQLAALMSSSSHILRTRRNTPVVQVKPACVEGSRQQRGHRLSRQLKCPDPAFELPRIRRRLHAGGDDLGIDVTRREVTSQVDETETGR